MRTRVPDLVLAGVLTVLLPAGLTAQVDRPKDAGKVQEATAGLGQAEQAAVVAWKSYQDKMAAYRKELAPISEKLKPIYQDLRAAQKAGADVAELQKQVDELRAQSAAVRKQLMPAMNKAMEAFQACFQKSNWNAYDVDQHTDLLQNGLMRTGQQAMEGKPQEAVKAFRAYLERFSDSSSAKYVSSMYLPSALVAAGDAAGARQHVQQLLDKAPNPELYITLGDLAAIEGKFEEAAKHWEQAGESSKYAQLRLKLVNKPAPEIDARQWIGGKAQPLSAHKGRVTILDFWATWCAPCRAVMPALSRFYEEYSDKGLQVIGVTRFYPNRDGYLPRNRSEMRSGGETVTGITEASLPAHLSAFKKNTGIVYPFAIGAQKNFTDYGISGIPTVVVVDASGKVVFVGVGGACEPMVRAAALRALQKVQKSNVSKDGGGR